MSFIEYNNTLAGFKKLKNDLARLTSIISYASMAIFSIYYIYLIVKNLKIPLYLIAYSIMFLILLSSFIVEISLRESKELDRKSRRLVIENKRKIKTLIKIPKYLVKATLIGIAIFETINNFDLNLSNIYNIILAIFLVLQILTDIIIHYITYYIDYFSRCIEQDYKQSGIVKFLNKFNINKQIRDYAEDETYKIKGESKYTKQEEKIYNDIEQGKLEIKKERKKEKQSEFKKALNKLKSAKKDKSKS